jgi:hypothetical protein
MNKEPGQVTISFEYRRHVGPRYHHGALRLRFDSRYPYTFRSLARWPEGMNYEHAIRAGVEDVMRERMGRLGKTEVVLEAITFDPVASSETAFRNAARAATEAAFSV